MKHSIMVTRDFSGVWKNLLRERYFMDLWGKDEPASREWLMQHIKGKEGALVMLTDRIDAEVLESADSLKAVSTMSVGYDHIDIDACRKRGIIVTNTPDVLTDATADMGMALLLSAARRVTEGDRFIRAGKWLEQWKPDFMLGSEISGKTLGIIGMGRIGRAVAERALGFRMKVLYSSRSEKRIDDLKRVDFEELLKESDYVIACVSLNDSTSGMMNRKAFALMKSSSVFVNISRGAVVDESDLYTALKHGTIRAAGLDVFQQEPLERGSPLMNLENIVLAPHLGSATGETRLRMAELAAENLARSLEGEEVVNIAQNRNDQ